MTDLSTQASTAASIPGATMQADPDRVPNIVVNPISKFDGRMHGRMAAAQSRGDWIEIADILTRAHGNSNLRNKVRARFLKDCPHAEMVAAFKTAIGHADPEQKVVTAAPQKSDREKHISACKRFDRAMHEGMSDAKDKDAWLAVLAEMLAAAKVSWEEPNGLRKVVRERFLKECPHEDILFRFNNETGTLPQRDPDAASPLGNKTRNGRDVEARRAANRADRLKDQTPKGKAGQTSEKKSGKAGKGKKK